MMTLGLVGAVATAVTGGIDPTISQDPALSIFGNEIGEALRFNRLLGVLLRIGLLWVALQIFEALIPRAARWRLGIAHTLQAWGPTVRLTVAGVIVLVIIDALTPDQPEARAIVAGGVILTVLWSAQAVLRNAAAGAIIIARRAVRVGEHLQVGEFAGEVTSVSLRGVEIRDADGSRNFIPGLLLHTETTTHGPPGVHATVVRVTWRLPDAVADRDTEEVRDLVKRLALLSARRAPGTPILVHQGSSSDELHITLTPYDRAESDALRLEVTRRLADAFTVSTEHGDSNAQGDTAGV
jgi:hypothetical protein